MYRYRLLLIFGWIGTWTASATAATEACVFSQVRTKVILESADRQVLLGKELVDIGQRLQALMTKAARAGPGPVGAQLSESDQQLFDKLGVEMTATRLKLLVESARERDVSVVFDLVNAAQRYYRKRSAPHSAEEARHRDILIQLEQRLAAKTVATPRKSTDCDIDSALAALQSDVEVSRDNVHDYVIAIELIRKMNRASEMIYTLDYADVEPAASVRSKALGQALGKSIQAAINTHQFPDDVVYMLQLWRAIDRLQPSRESKFLSSLTR